MVTRRVLTLLAVVLCSAQARYRSYSREELAEGADAITLSYSAVSARCLEYDYTMQVEFRSTQSGGFGMAATVSLGSFLASTKALSSFFILRFK